MSKSPSPESSSRTFLKFLGLGLPQLVLAGLIACGGSSAVCLGLIRLPFGGLRLWDTATGWAQINTSRASRTGPTWMVSSGRPIMVYFLYNLARTPAWISSNPNDSTCAYSTSAEGGPGQCDPPSDLDAQGGGTDRHGSLGLQPSAIQKCGLNCLRNLERVERIALLGRNRGSTGAHGAGC